MENEGVDGLAAPMDLPTGKTKISQRIIGTIRQPYNYIPLGIAIGTYLHTKSAKKALVVGGIAYLASGMYFMSQMYE